MAKRCVFVCFFAIFFTIFVVCCKFLLGFFLGVGFASGIFCLFVKCLLMFFKIYRLSLFCFSLQDLCHDSDFLGLIFFCIIPDCDFDL